MRHRSEEPRFTHGGRRVGAGRKPGRRPAVLHRTRPLHLPRHPSHVTVTFRRTAAGSLREERIFNVLRRVFLEPKIEGFQVVHHSVQKDHVHLVVEAVDRRAFSSGMRSLEIRAARRINALFGRRQGRVIRDRYHRRDLFSAKQVRRALRYVLLNGAKHGVVGPGQIDRYSSGPWFDGWDAADLGRWRPPAIGHPAARRPWTRLLALDWRALGPISPYEAIRWAPLEP